MSPKKYSLYIMLLAMMAAGMASCKKSKMKSFDEPTMVHFYKDLANYFRDSSVFSFAIFSPDHLYDTVKLPIRIAGNAADKDRQVKLQAVADSSNAIAGTDYAFGNAIVHAGRFLDTVYLIVKRTPEMKTQEKRLLLEIVASNDLQPGVYNSPVGSGNNVYSGASVRMLVKINDFLTKPGNWDNMLVYFFGDYSQRKYKFIIEKTGRAQFPVGGGPNDISYGEISAIQIFLRQALLDYNKEHGDMIDENGGIVTF
ncbi:DUF4843 domain-containing protein [Pseudoflavitalea sp. G-6-1-2]|uniref:DUF4843 domain-containing protein n=1 Tax=Pseudoflavitalea sp. G-6-1-2 TaxID=2728841 RepID=UPI00146B21F5|nr:DUF4843 domain-containing protein [Pseudoflavitalea sp. G-6-1-2]NML21751.1 DUF4843 domain-containing protein [Pseudoflavitalea sp. G-6-1-2]